MFTKPPTAGGSCAHAREDRYPDTAAARQFTHVSVLNQADHSPVADNVRTNGSGVTSMAGFRWARDARFRGFAWYLKAYLSHL
jgi:hypothetical protein